MNPKKFILAAAIILSMANMQAQVTVIDSGYCGANAGGTNLTWTLYSDSVLRIHGSGNMANYVWSTDVPWNSYRDFFNTVIIGDSVTTIGQCAFLWYSN